MSMQALIGASSVKRSPPPFEERVTTVLDIVSQAAHHKVCHRSAEQMLTCSWQRHPENRFAPEFIPHKVTGRYHGGELSAPNDTSTHRYFPALGERGFARAIVGLSAKHGHMPKSYEQQTGIKKVCIAL